MCELFLQYPKIIGKLKMNIAIFFLHPKVGYTFVEFELFFEIDMCTVSLSTNHCRTKQYTKIEYEHCCRFFYILGLDIRLQNSTFLFEIDMCSHCLQWVFQHTIAGHHLTFCNILICWSFSEAKSYMCVEPM